MSKYRRFGGPPQPWRRRPALRSILAASLLVLSTIGQTQAAAHTFLWKVSGKQNVVYLVGSMHLLTKDLYPLNPALDGAYKDSDLLVEELDLGEMMAGQLEMLLRAKLPADQSLDKVLSPSTYAQVNKRIAGLGLPAGPLDQFKPWFLALTIEALEWQKAGFDAELGLDKHFYDLAHTDGKNVQGLETVGYQVSLFDGMTMEQQDRMLADTLKDLDTEIGNINKLVDAWKSGDAAAVERIVLADLKQDPVMYQRLLVQRNQNWMPKLEALFSRRGRAFVVVGAAHLVGPDGLIALLKARGYSVEQM